MYIQTLEICISKHVKCISKHLRYISKHLNSCAQAWMMPFTGNRAGAGDKKQKYYILHPKIFNDLIFSDKKVYGKVAFAKYSCQCIFPWEMLKYQKYASILKRQNFHRNVASVARFFTRNVLFQKMFVAEVPAFESMSISEQKRAAVLVAGRRCCRHEGF